MSPIVNLVIFICLGIASFLLSILVVLSKNLLRSATYLLLVLLCTAGFYLFLNYHFLAAVQVSVYSGGVVILFIFAIFLTNNKNEIFEEKWWRRHAMGGLVMLGGIAVATFALLKNRFFYIDNHTIKGDREINMQLIGKTLVGVGKYQYLLPFEVLSLLLLACIIGGILIARKR